MIQADTSRALQIGAPRRMTIEEAQDLASHFVGESLYFERCALSSTVEQQHPEDVEAQAEAVSA